MSRTVPPGQKLSGLGMPRAGRHFDRTEAPRGSGTAGGSGEAAAISDTGSPVEATVELPTASAEGAPAADAAVTVSGRAGGRFRSAPAQAPTVDFVSRRLLRRGHSLDPLNPADNARMGTLCLRHNADDDLH